MNVTSESNWRVEFDATIDECVDAQIRMANRTKTYRRRRRERVLLGIMVAVVFAVTILVLASYVTVLDVAVAVGGGLGFGLLSSYLYGIYFDWHVRHYGRRLTKEMYGGASTVRFEIELRPDAVWAKSRGTEISFAWTSLTGIENAEHGIELWFDPGLVIVRSRAFASADARQQFLERARELAPRWPSA
jgi:hypothetical protein